MINNSREKHLYALQWLKTSTILILTSKTTQTFRCQPLLCSKCWTQYKRCKKCFMGFELDINGVCWPGMGTILLMIMLSVLLIGLLICCIFGTLRLCSWGLSRMSDSEKTQKKLEYEAKEIERRQKKYDSYRSDIREQWRLDRRNLSKLQDKKLNYITPAKLRLLETADSADLASSLTGTEVQSFGGDINEIQKVTASTIRQKKVRFSDPESDSQRSSLKASEEKLNLMKGERIVDGVLRGKIMFERTVKVLNDDCDFLD